MNLKFVATPPADQRLDDAVLPDRSDQLLQVFFPKNRAGLERRGNNPVEGHGCTRSPFSTSEWAMPPAR